MLESLFALLGLNGNPAMELPPIDLLSIAPAPQRIEQQVAPIINATAAIAFDLDSKKTLWEKQGHKPHAIASLTKLMTAVIVRENFNLTDKVIVSANAAAQLPAKIWLKTNEEISVENLLHALLIKSGNDAAVALAEHIGTELLVGKMNTKAHALGLKNTHFANPVGFDDVENYSTVHDLAILSSYVLRDPVLRKIVAMKKATIYSTDKKIKHDFVSTNKLFDSYLDIRGLKTGLTKIAGACFAAVARSKNNEHEILVIVLNSPQRFQETKIVLEWAIRSHRW